MNADTVETRVRVAVIGRDDEFYETEQLISRVNDRKVLHSFRFGPNPIDISPEKVRIQVILAV